MGEKREKGKERLRKGDKEGGRERGRETTHGRGRDGERGDVGTDLMMGSWPLEIVADITPGAGDRDTTADMPPGAGDRDTASALTPPVSPGLPGTPMSVVDNTSLAKLELERKLACC